MASPREATTNIYDDPTNTTVLGFVQTDQNETDKSIEIDDVNTSSTTGSSSKEAQ